MADPAQKPQRAKTSDVWRFFERVRGEPKVRCTLCSPEVYELKYSGSTTTLAYHLKTKHARDYHGEGVTDGEASETPTRSRSTSEPAQPGIAEFIAMTGERKNQLDRLCLKWLTCNMRPFLLVEDRELKEYISAISSGRYRPPSRKTLTAMTPDLFLTLETYIWGIIQEHFKDSLGIWITVDGWTSRAGYSYLGIIAHYLTKDFRPVSFLLSAVQSNNHDSDSIAEEVKKTIETWEFVKFASGMVGDNTNTVPATARKIAEDPSFEEFEYWGCVAHLVNLVVKHSLELSEPASLVAKCRAIVTHIHKSAQALEKLHEYEQELSCPKLGVVQDVEGRWSSTYSMLSRLVRIQEPLIKTLKNRQRRDLLLTTTEWKIVSELITCLQPFALLTELISGSTGSLFSSCIPIITNLKNRTAVPPVKASATVEVVTKKLHTLIEHYFFGDEFLNLLSPTALIYCLLDPRFKNLDFVPKEDAERARQLLIDLHSKLHCNSTVDRMEIDEQEQQTYNLYGLTAEPHGTARQTLDTYYKEPILNVLHNPLDWWKLHRDTYPALAALAQKLLGRTSTSVPCERLFSEAGNIVNELRSSLDPDSVAMLLFIEHNVRELRKIDRPFTWQT